MELLIKGGRVIDPGSGLDREPWDVLVAGGKIAALGRDLAPHRDTEIIEACGCIVCPGLIDMHVHLREPGFEYKETIASGTRAAARGGITAVACMPNTEPPADNPGTLAWIRERARQAGVVRVWPVACVTRSRKGEELAEMAILAEAGAVAFSDDGNPVARAAMMRHALEYASRLGKVVISHAEDTDLARDGVMHEGYRSLVLGLRGIPAAAEEVMVARDIILAGLTGSRVHLAHLSTQGSVEMLRQAREKGLPVTGEVTPHHFTLTEAAVAGYDTNTKVNPPLRTTADVAALKKALATGVIDVIASDHAPHAAQEKMQDFDQAPFGMVGLETLVPLVATELVAGGVLSWPQAVAALTVNPARILGLPYGGLTAGATADITIIDSELELTVDVSKFASAGKNSPFHGRKLKGWPVATIVGGRMVMCDRELVS